MQRFVAKQNIEHFREMLLTESDPGRRALLERMIAEEEAKLCPPASDEADDVAGQPSLGQAGIHLGGHDDHGGGDREQG